MTIDEAELKMEMAVEHLEGQLSKVRTGRASPSVLSSLMVEVYGAPTPLNHIANVMAVDAQLLQVQPFDPSNLANISTAIRNDSSLGLNPSDDGKVIRIPIPPMTEERRREVVKQLGAKAEESKVSLRNVRHDVLKAAKAQEKEGDISKDDLQDTQKQVDDMVSGYQTKIDALIKAKEADVMKV